VEDEDLASIDEDYDFLSNVKNYVTSWFLYDLITLIPLQYMKLKNNRERLFYLIKVTRVFKGYKLFNVSQIMSNYKEY
jgi:hypothetical protein